MYRLLCTTIIIFFSCLINMGFSQNYCVPRQQTHVHNNNVFDIKAYPNQFDKFDNHNFGFDQVIVVPTKITSLVEVPNLEVVENLVIITDQFGNIIDTQKQITFEINRVKRKQFTIQIKELVFE